MKECYDGPLFAVNSEQNERNGRMLRSEQTSMNSPKRLQLIACKVMQKEAYLCAARSPHTIDMVLMKQGLHDTPDLLREEVGKALACTEDVQGNPYDATLLGYGLCSNGIVGLSAEIPIVVPRAHDCITLLLGSKERYKEYFDSHRGIYWYSPGWIEFGNTPSAAYYEKKLREYEAKYGKENAEYLLEAEQGWLNEYEWATYVDWDLPNTQGYREYTQHAAEHLGLKFDDVRGDSSLMQRFFDGKWDDADFLVVPPGKKIADDLTKDSIVRAE